MGAVNFVPGLNGGVADNENVLDLNDKRIKFILDLCMSKKENNVRIPGTIN